MVFFVLCLVSSFEALLKCCAKARKQCQNADTAVKDEATQLAYWLYSECKCKRND